MLGEIVDDFTVKVVDVFAMPQVRRPAVASRAVGSRRPGAARGELALRRAAAQSGTGVSVEAVDPVFQTKMLDMLKQTGRPEVVVGWYHSCVGPPGSRQGAPHSALGLTLRRGRHPGFGCWLSGTDVNTQQSFEALNARAVAVVVDPVQSVKGKVVIDAFRLINPQTMMLGQEPRQTTSNLGHLHKPSIQALIHGLNKHYYSLAIGYRKHELEEKMLLNLHKPRWTDAFALEAFDARAAANAAGLAELEALAGKYDAAVVEEAGVGSAAYALASVGKQDAKKRLEEGSAALLAANVVQTLGAMLDTVVF